LKVFLKRLMKFIVFIWKLKIFKLMKNRKCG